MGFGKLLVLFSIALVGLASSASADGVPDKVADKVADKSPSDKGLVEFYGFVKLDAAFDSANMKNGDYALAVPAQSKTRSGPQQFTITANQTRIGLNLKAPTWEGWQTSGKIEFDFYNPVEQADNKAVPMLRHAYLQLDSREWGLSLLAGQTWDVIAPLNPGTLNYSVNWNAGNLGYRRPQIRLTKAVAVSDESKFTGELALTRAISDSALYSPASGEDSAGPGVQGRVAYSRAFAGRQPLSVGLSGSWSRPRDFSGLTAAGAPESASAYNTFTQWSVGLDASLPITPSLMLSGEWYSGQDLKSLFGISTVTSYNGVAEREQGAWAQLAFAPAAGWGFNVGFSEAWILDAEDLPVGALSANGMAFVNCLYHLNPATQVGVEYSHWISNYAQADQGQDDRVQFSLQFNF